MAAGTDDKKPNVLVRSWGKITRTVRDMRGEMKRVVWPSAKQTTNNTVIVIVFMVVMALVIGLFDTGLSLIIKAVFGA